MPIHTATVVDNGRSHEAQASGYAQTKPATGGPGAGALAGSDPGQQQRQSTAEGDRLRTARQRVQESQERVLGIA